MSAFNTMRVLTVLVAVAPVAAYGLSFSHASHFQQWYPQFAQHMVNATKFNCTQEFDDYVNNPREKEHPEAIASAIITCLYASKYIDDGIKSNFASAAVLLGLLPTMLSTVGSNPLEGAMLSLRRPLLSTLLTFGSPAPTSIRSFEYTPPGKMLKDRTENVHLPDGPKYKNKNKNNLLVLFQWLITLASIANTMDLALELGFRTVSSWAPSRTWTILLWTLLGVAVHLLSVVSLRLRVTVDIYTNKGGPRPASWRERVWRGIEDEFTVTATHSRTELALKPESRAFVIWSWFTSVAIALQNVYGTLTFSGLLFIGVQDSAIVVLRYFLSAIFCRIVLMFELKGMRQASGAAGLSRKNTLPLPSGPPTEIEHHGNTATELDHMHLHERRKQLIRGNSEMGLLSNVSIGESDALNRQRALGGAEASKSSARADHSRTWSP